MISVATSVIQHLFPQFPIYFDEFGAILMAVILEPCAGICIALINDVLCAIYSGSAFSIITFFASAMYTAIFT